MWPTPEPTREFDEAVAAGDLEPRLGSLGSLEVANALVDVLGPATTTPDDAHLLIWQGWGYIDYARWPGAAEVELEQRPCVLLGGPMTYLAEDLASGPFAGHSGAQLAWPADHAWVIATEVDFPYTLIGGSATTVEALLSDTRLRRS